MAEGYEHLIIRDFAPNVAPKLIGQHWVDKTALRMWFSLGVSSTADWIEQPFGASNNIIYSKTYIIDQDPEGFQVARVGDFALDTVTGFFYVKASGDNTNTGWIVH